MSSTNKTNFLGLNSWIPTDVPKRADFNEDNSILDRSISEHFNDKNVHINNNERNTWNTPYFVGTYYGDGSSSQKIATNCPFTPSFGIIFAKTAAPAITDFSSKINYNYSAFVTPRGSSVGATISGTVLTVSQSASPATSNEYAALNGVGYTYMYILFR